jgi:hypothetical protein
MIVLFAFVSAAFAVKPDMCNTSPPGPSGYAVMTGKVIYGALDPTPLDHRSGDETVGICQLSGGVYTLKEVANCTSSTDPDNPLGISDVGAPTTDSTVGPVVTAAGKMCRDSRPGKGSAPILLYPFADSFDFGLWYTGYCGSDKIYGTPGRDFLRTTSDASAGAALPPTFTSGGAACPGLTTPEIVCGYGGDDEIFTQNGANLGVCVDAGSQDTEDECYVSSTFAIDSALDCEIEINLPGFDECDCGCGEAPSDSWFPNYPGV